MPRVQVHLILSVILPIMQGTISASSKNGCLAYTLRLCSLSKPLSAADVVLSAHITRDSASTPLVLTLASGNVRGSKARPLTALPTQLPPGHLLPHACWKASAADMQYVVGIKGRSVILPCFASYKDRPYNISDCWYYENMPIYCFSSSASSNRFSPRISLLESNNINLSELSMEDAGTFTCQRSGSQWGQLKLSVTGGPITPGSNVGLRALLKGPAAVVFLLWLDRGLNHQSQGGTPRTHFGNPCTVLTLPVAVSRPTITRVPDREIINYGTSITFTCESQEGSWPIEYTWSRLDPETGHYVSVGHTGKTLSFSQVEVGHSGLYRCTASNKVEGKTRSNSTDILLTVQSPIRGISLTMEPWQFFSFEGQPLELRCQVEAGSEPITWTWFRVPVWDGDKQANHTHEVGHERDLRLGKVAQSGRYSCRAQNRFDGHDVTLNSKTVTVHIIPNPNTPPLSWVSLVVGMCALLAVIFLYCQMHVRKNYTCTLEGAATQQREKQELRTMKNQDCLKTQPQRRASEANRYESTVRQDAFYCPLSQDQHRDEDVYDDLT
ncbi:hypothetical protein JZ751_019160 [Albula glossodonta]|uniref:Ig-like domain-containing protein n=1 Tax=Albula glossodonta TaxID=121402 RepID=A0A8T2MV20_9TELE|nr:hypothetical protein JZ751_019160 [Albula glossodonta]